MQKKLIKYLEEQKQILLMDKTNEEANALKEVRIMLIELKDVELSNEEVLNYIEANTSIRFGFVGVEEVL